MQLNIMSFIKVAINKIKFISIANDLSHDKIMLHTQTPTWLATKLYLDTGFELFNVDEKTGWRILKTLTN